MSSSNCGDVGIVFNRWIYVRITVWGKEASRSYRSRGRIEWGGKSLYVYTPTGSRVLIDYPLSELQDSNVLANARLTFSPKEQILVLNYSDDNYYFAYKDNKFVFIRVIPGLYEKNPVANDDGLIATFRETAASNPRQLIIWNLFSTFRLTQDLNENLYGLRFSPDGKFLVGLSAPPPGPGETQRGATITGFATLRLWLADPDKLFELAKYRFANAS